MTAFSLGFLVGLIVLAWSAKHFVEGAAASARHFGMPPLAIGMFIIGFGTSAPELMVSMLSAQDGMGGMALGNAYGSNITNLGVALGLTALFSPVAVHSRVLSREVPYLAAVTVLSMLLLLDGAVARWEALLLMACFGALVIWTMRQKAGKGDTALADEMAEELQSRPISLKWAILKTTLGLGFLLGSSKLLVWAGVGIAQYFGISDLVIGLTVLALGTSLPEIASSFVAGIKGEDDLALGNILGSNLFNALGVVGVSTLVYPLSGLPGGLVSRDMLVSVLMLLPLYAVLRQRRTGAAQITRPIGAILLSGYVMYVMVLFWSERSV